MQLGQGPQHFSGIIVPTLQVLTSMVEGVWGRGEWRAQSPALSLGLEGIIVTILTITVARRLHGRSSCSASTRLGLSVCGSHHVCCFPEEPCRLPAAWGALRESLPVPSIHYIEDLLHAGDTPESKTGYDSCPPGLTIQ